jgi:hypothetical protein
MNFGEKQAQRIKFYIFWFFFDLLQNFFSCIFFSSNFFSFRVFFFIFFSDFLSDNFFKLALKVLILNFYVTQKFKS